MNNELSVYITLLAESYKSLGIYEQNNSRDDYSKELLEKANVIYSKIPSAERKNT
jgi:hypothetical protein